MTSRTSYILHFHPTHIGGFALEEEPDLWRKIENVLQNELIPKREIFEVPLPLLGFLLWPDKDSNELKHANKILAKMLRSKRIKIVRRHGVRFAQIPLDKIQKKRAKILVEEVWRW